MFGKIENGRLVIAGQKIEIENGWITNPTEEQLRANGYKTVEYTEKPTFDREEEKLTEVYNEEQDKIIVLYAKDMLTDEEHNAVVQQEIIEEENKMTARNIRCALMGDTFANGKITDIENNIQLLRTKLRETTNEE